MADLLQPARGIPMLVALLAVVIVAPFERALFTLPGGLTITSVELVTLVALGTMCVAHVRRHDATLPSVPRSVACAGAAVIATLVIATLLTPFGQANAARFVARMVIAASLFVVTCRLIDTHARALLVATVVVIVAAVVAAIAVLEATQVPVVMALLTAFRPGFHVVAGQLRATSTLIYPTIASMFLEIAFAIGLWLLLHPTTGQRRAFRAVVFATLTLIGAGISATFTRAGLLAMAAAIVTVALLRSVRGTRDRADVAVLGGLAVALIGVVFVTHSPELLAARVTTEGSDAWYGAQYVVPATLDMQTAGRNRIPITVSNTGRLTWDSSREPTFFLSYHWLRANADAVVVFEGERTAFPRPVRPGQSVMIFADVLAPAEPGEYTLVWDVVHETRAWLSTEGVTSARTHVVVRGAPARAAVTTMTQLPQATRRPPRAVLWEAALQIAREHPALGIGPDNYRLAYGRYLGVGEWDSRVHANSMYLEMLTGAGVLGLTSWLCFAMTTGRVLWRRVRAARAEAHAATAAAFAVWIVIFGHGVVDSFLSFTPTYVAFAVAGGWALSPGILQGAHDAHRV